MQKKKSKAYSQGKSPKGKFMKKCGRVLLISASYQIFSLCMNPGDKPNLSGGQGKGKSWLGKTSSQIFSAFISPANASEGKQVMDHDNCSCTGCTVCTSRIEGCTNCTGCTSCTSCTVSCTGCTGCTGCTSETSNQEIPSNTHFDDNIYGN